MRLLAAHAGSIAYVLILMTVSIIPVTTLWTTPAPGTSAPHSMTPFSSYQQIHDFIFTMSCNGSGVRSLVGGSAPATYPVAMGGDVTTLGVSFGASGSTSVPNHSSTNVQVAGVDELDTVKSDGTYLYTVTNNTVAIVLAYPVSAAKLLARISVNGSLQGIFVGGNRLVVISQSFQYYPVVFMASAQPVIGGMSPQPVTGVVSLYPAYTPPTSSLRIYDISDHSNPILTTTLVVNGTLAGARLIGNFAYMIATQPVYCNQPLVLPESIVNGLATPTAPGIVYHSDIADYAHSFTTVVGIDISQANPTPSAKVFLIGTSSTIYVSTSQIYLTQPIWSLTEQTAIHRISISGSNISYDATGTVSGHVLNQFSMDEYNGFFRIVTSTYGGYIAMAAASGSSSSYVWRSGTNLYVLDSGLHIVGAIEGLSPGEFFYAARFMGDRAYLVTYQRMDPLFVVDLQDPFHPRVLGQLNITGVSDYLQPYDDTHLIGLGKSSLNVTWENAALFQGLKLSLFDVTDPNNPIATSNYLVGDRGSDSPALYDHKAVLFDKSLNLLVIPVQIALAQPNSTNPWWNPVVWQGAYVFSVTLQGGIVFRGGITQIPNGGLPYSNYNLWVTRTLYIGNVLYTISNNMVTMNSLTDLSGLGSVSLA